MEAGAEAEAVVEEDFTVVAVAVAGRRPLPFLPRSASALREALASLPGCVAEESKQRGNSILP